MAGCGVVAQADSRIGSLMAWAFLLGGLIALYSSGKTLADLGSSDGNAYTGPLGANRNPSPTGPGPLST